MRQSIKSLTEGMSRTIQDYLKTGTFFLNFCVNHKTYTFLLATYYLLPFVIANYEKIFHITECGNFEMYRTDNLDPEKHFFDRANRLCFAPLEQYPGIIFCQVNTPLEPAQGQLIINISDNPVTKEICSKLDNLNLHLRNR